MSFSILGTGSRLPALTVTNDDLSRIVETNDEWISSRTGIRSRQIAVEETLTEMAAEAGRRALENAGIRAEDLDLILCSTIQGDYITPSLANLVQRDLGAHCPAFDINAACCGFVYGLDVAQAYMDADKARYILMVSAEQMSKHVDWSDRSTCVLFGDGAAAAVLGKGDALCYLQLTSSGSTESLQIPAPLHTTPFSNGETAEKADKLLMNGQNVFKFAVSACTEGIRKALDTLRLTADDIGCFLIHQANARIVDSIRRTLGQSVDKFPTNVEHTGNTSSVSIPCLLDELNRSGRLKRGEKLLISAFGAGWTTGNCILQWQK